DCHRLRSRGPRSLIGAAAGKFGRQRLRRRGEFLQLLEDGEQLAFDGDADAAGLAHGAPNLTLSLEQTPQFGLGFHGCSCLYFAGRGQESGLGAVCCSGIAPTPLSALSDAPTWVALLQCRVTALRPDARIARLVGR